MINPYPHELSIGDVYYSPILQVLFFSFLAALITVMLLNKLKLSRHLYAPSYIFIAIMTLYIIVIDTYWIKF
jgi:predicted neutral ceramidase superfamily lipid hydrolase